MTDGTYPDCALPNEVLDLDRSGTDQFWYRFFSFLYSIRHPQNLMLILLICVLNYYKEHAQ